MKRYLLLISFLLITTFTYSQTDSAKITITGKILDSLTKQPIEFATISFKNGENLVGTTSNSKGKFSFAVLPDRYLIKIEFLSYSPIQFKNKELKSDLDLGTINLSPNIENLDEIEIVAQKDLMEYSVDKKVYNASKDIANYGGNAMDVLNNAPSVRVDDEGNVIMRGTTARVLVDGKPLFGLESGNDILSSIPSSSIDKVEIITRSAKYSAEGGGGIINIITKKRKGSSLSGSIDIHGGSPDSNGFSTFLNESTEKINLFSTISFNNEKGIKRITIDQAYFDNGNNPSGSFDQTRRDDNQRNSFLFNIGSDFYLNDKNTLTTSFLVNTNNKNFISNLNLNDFDITNNLTRSALRTIGDFDDTSKIETFLNYTTTFEKEEHKLSFDFKYDNTISENKADIAEEEIIPTSDAFDQKVSKNQNLDNFLIQLDYTLPINENNKIELGHKSTLRFYENDYNVSEFDETLNDFITVGGFEGTINYDEKVYAFYGQYSATYNNLSYSLGVRSGISNIALKEGTSSNSISKRYTDFFPSATLSYEFEDGGFLSANYSRSIDRPSIAQLNPFISLNDERFQSVGNPDLNPYYSDYFELVYDKGFDKLNVTSALFLNYSKDQFLTVIQNTGQNADGLDTFKRTFINSGDKNIIGVDLDLTYTPFKGLRLGAYVSPYRLDISNTINNSYDFTSWVWYAETYALVSLNNGLRIKAHHYYQSPITDGQTKLRTINFSNLTVSKSLFKKKGTLTFKALDIFNTKWFSTRSFEANTNTLRRVRYDRQFSLSFTYRFNQKRQSRKDRSEDINEDVLEDKQDEKL